jgi:uncharacterized protein (DUF58 family)
MLETILETLVTISYAALVILLIAFALLLLSVGWFYRFRKGAELEEEIRKCKEERHLLIRRNRALTKMFDLTGSEQRRLERFSTIIKMLAESEGLDNGDEK